MSAELPRLITKEGTPIYPCWLWGKYRNEPFSPGNWVKHEKKPVGGYNGPNYWYTHWLPDSPDQPTVIPSTPSQVQGETPTPRTDAKDCCNELGRRYKSSQSSLALAQARAGEAEKALEVERGWVKALTADNGVLIAAADKTKAGRKCMEMVGQLEEANRQLAALRSQAEQSTNFDTRKEGAPEETNGGRVKASGVSPTSPPPSAQPASEDCELAGIIGSCATQIAVMREGALWNDMTEVRMIISQAIQRSAILRRHQPAPQVGDGKTKEDGK